MFRNLKKFHDNIFPDFLNKTIKLIESFFDIDSNYVNYGILLESDRNDYTDILEEIKRIKKNISEDKKDKLFLKIIDKSNQLFSCNNYKTILLESILIDNLYKSFIKDIELDDNLNSQKIMLENNIDKLKIKIIEMRDIEKSKNIFYCDVENVYNNIKENGGDHIDFFESIYYNENNKENYNIDNIKFLYKFNIGSLIRNRYFLEDNDLILNFKYKDFHKHNFSIMKYNLLCDKLYNLNDNKRKNSLIKEMSSFRNELYKMY